MKGGGSLSYTWVKWVLLMLSWIALTVFLLSTFPLDTNEHTGNPGLVFDVDRSIPLVEGPPKYFVLIPGFGPNNQYIAFKEAVSIAKALGRVMVLPPFVKHYTKGKEGYKPFESTFDASLLEPIIPTISMEEFHKIREEIDAVFWVRGMVPWWEDHLKNYQEITGLKVLKNVPPDLKSEGACNMDGLEICFTTEEFLVSYLKSNGIYDVEVLGFGFPFRNVGGYFTATMNQVTSVLERSPFIKDLAEKAWRTIGDKDTVLTMHWRHGEQTCTVEPKAYHEGYDFCFGTSAYTWAKMDDVVEILKKEMELHNIQHIYLATDCKDKELFSKLQSRLPIKKASDVQVLANMTDNYYLSLVEQEMCSQSKFFIASLGSTWSEFISNYWKTKDASSKIVTSLEDLLKKYNKPVLSHSFWSYILNSPEIPSPGCVLEDTDYTGNDYFSTSADSAQTCYNLCLKDTNCACWSFVANHHACYMKGPSCPTTTAPKEGVQSGPKKCPQEYTGPNNCFLKNTDFKGSDLPSAPITETPEECFEHCSKTAECSCWSLANKQCWMKNSCELIWKYNVVSGRRTCAEHPITPRILESPNVTQTLLPTQPTNPKSEPPTNTTNQFQKTGPGNCLFKDTDIKGNDISNIKATEPLECISHCNHTVSCKCWSFSYSGHCWLKNSCEPKFTNQGVLSGPSWC